ncbi:MAG TPA: CBS domain-containing protein, partial [Candidatus Nitrosocosmicus sp.]|nr:CBS domain-containing protein [Candidatus Nitrosocosmicus sp.]
ELKKLYIPIEYVSRIHESIIITKKYETVDLSDNELYVDRNVIDKQIIDIAGSKVVRANDLLIQQRGKTNYSIMGVDIGILGIIRWFGIAPFMERMNYRVFNKPIKRSVLSWSDIQPLEMAQGKIVLNVEQQKLQNLHPEDLADYLESTNIKNVISIINSLEKEFASEVVAELNLNYQISLLRKLSLEKTAKIIEFMDPDEAVDVLSEFPTRRRNLILNKISSDSKKQIESLLKFSHTSVGRYITNDFVTVKSTWTAGKVLQYLRKTSVDLPLLNYIYVVNEKNQLIGVFNLHELILQHTDTLVYKFMEQNLIIVHLKTALQIVLRKLIRYKIFAIPVIDENKKMLGIVTIDDISEVFLDKITNE